MRYSEDKYYRPEQGIALHPGRALTLQTALCSLQCSLSPPRTKDVISKRDWLFLFSFPHHVPLTGCLIHT